MAIKSILPLFSREKYKLLADPRRRAIMRQVLAGPTSLTKIGKAIGEHPAWVRHHLQLLERADLVELVSTTVNSGVVEKFYQAKGGGFFFQDLILPDETDRPLVIFSGSHDLAIEYLTELVSNYVDIRVFTVGSLDGLMMLRQNLCHFSGAHLLDLNGEYNLPFVRHIFPDRDMQVVTLANRMQGLITVAGNPKSIHSIQSLAGGDIKFINRNTGSGTRIWLDQQLHALKITPEEVNGYSHTVSTHTDAARRVKEGYADVTLGLQAAANQFDLHFIPLFEERYDLVFSKEQASKISPLLDTIQSLEFRKKVKTLTGYATTNTGTQLI